MITNNISKAITPTEKSDTITAINGQVTFFDWFRNLTEEERKELVKMGPKSGTFVRGVLTTLNAHTTVAGALDLTEYNKDLKLFDDLSEIGAVLIPFTEGLKDTLMVLGNELMQQANAGYALLQQAANTDSSLSEIVATLGQRYERGTRAIANIFSIKGKQSVTLNGIVPDRQLRVLLGGPFTIYKGGSASGENRIVSSSTPLQLPSGWTTITAVNMGDESGAISAIQK